MTVKDKQKNKEYFTKHRTTARATMCYTEYRSRKKHKHAILCQQEKARKVQEAKVLPPFKLSIANELFELPKLQRLDIKK